VSAIEAALLSRLAMLRLLALLPGLLSTALLLLTGFLLVLIPIVATTAQLLIRLRIVLLLLLRISVRILLVHDVMLLVSRPAINKTKWNAFCSVLNTHDMMSKTCPILAMELFTRLCVFDKSLRASLMEWYLLLLLLLGIQIPILIVIWMMGDLRS
jgi:hypothetical protein